jgi:hypothetical protein
LAPYFWNFACNDDLPCVLISRASAKPPNRGDWPSVSSFSVHRRGGRRLSCPRATVRAALVARLFLRPAGRVRARRSARLLALLCSRGCHYCRNSADSTGSSSLFAGLGQSSAAHERSTPISLCVRGVAPCLEFASLRSERKSRWPRCSSCLASSRRASRERTSVVPVQCIAPTDDGAVHSRSIWSVRCIAAFGVARQVISSTSTQRRKD